VGYVERLTAYDARGWAWAASAPDSIQQVEAVLEGRVIGRATTGIMRADLRARNFGNGAHGFEMVFDEPLSGSNIPYLQIIIAGQPIRLPGAYKIIMSDGIEPAAGEPLASADLVSGASLKFQGYVESMTRWDASGWAWSPESPNSAVQVEARLHGKLIGHATADRLRPDLEEQKYGTGHHGFEIRFEREVIGERPPDIVVIGSNGVTRLPGGDKLPALGTSPVPPFLNTQPTDAGSKGELLASVTGYVESVSRRGARGWAWSPADPDAVLQIEAIFDGRVIGRATADRMRPDLLKRNYGTGRYGFAMSFDEPATGDRAPEFLVFVPSAKRLPGVKTLPAPTPEDGSTRPPNTIATWSREHALFTSRGPQFEEFDRDILKALTEKSVAPTPLLCAFYLTQYHAIPENDDFWGKGFTEWRQIARGVSRFPGHYQPRIPRDLGFYDLTNLDTFRVQSELARAAGIQAFAFYYYWFNGKRVLEKPLEMILASNVSMPFLILWANENWTRTWDGSESEVLLRQDYRSEDEDALLEDLARHFLDPRYVRIAGRPLFVIYNPESIPEPAATIDRWRRILMARYGLEPLIFMAQTFGARDPKQYGCDGAMEFPPHKTAEKMVGRLVPDAYAPGFIGQVLNYDDFVAESLKELPPGYDLIKTAVPSWDNESRRPNRSLTLENLSPEKYQAWLRTLIERAIEKPIRGTPIVAINAWNEWAEAAYLEPDVYYGSSYLNATARAYVTAVNDYVARQSMHR
jgi:hypothetical protein